MTTEFNEMWARFSPDGKWIAYQSDQTRQAQIYVSRFPLTHERWPISTQGGRLPVWHPNGKELFYLTSTGLMAVDVKSDASGVHAGVPHSLFDIRTAQFGERAKASPFGISKNGKQFFFAIPHDSEETNPMTVILNWPALLSH